MVRLLRFLWLCVLWYALFVALMTLAYRFVAPVSTLMLGSAVQGSVQRQWVPLGRISPGLQRAVIVAEDARFCQHGGIDWEAVRRAFDRNNARGRVTHGASTLTMQVAKNLFLWNGRFWVRKAMEAPIALWIDFTLPKRRVLEIYLNTAEWGEHLYGAEAAARHYFGRPAAQLTPEQAALLAAALPNPKARNPARPSAYHREQAGTIRARMASGGADLSCLR